MGFLVLWELKLKEIVCIVIEIGGSLKEEGEMLWDFLWREEGI